LIVITSTAEVNGDIQREAICPVVSPRTSLIGHISFTSSQIECLRRDNGAWRNGQGFGKEGDVMLVLTRKKDESIVIGDDIVITIVDVRGDKVRLGINAPNTIPVHRMEVWEAIQRELKSAEAAQLEGTVGGAKAGQPKTGGAKVSEPKVNEGAPGEEKNSDGANSQASNEPNPAPNS
jgi:carbon storage regulator